MPRHIPDSAYAYALQKQLIITLKYFLFLIIENNLAIINPHFFTTTYKSRILIEFVQRQKHVYYHGKALSNTHVR